MSTSEDRGHLLRTGRADPLVLDRSVYKRLGKVFRKDRGSAPGLGTCSLPGPRTGYWAVIEAANEAACRFRPGSVTTSLFLPEGSGEEKLRELEDGIREAALQTGLFVAGGRTEVTAAVNTPVVTAAVSGKPDAEAYDTEVPHACMELVACGYAGLSGSVFLAEYAEEELSGCFPSFLLENVREMSGLAAAGEALAAAAGTGAFLQHVSTGGIFAGLWHLSEETGFGFTADLPSVPIRQETIEIAEHFGINPYELWSEGMFLAAAAEGKGEELCARLRELGFPASRIGQLEAGKGRRITNRGETRDLGRPGADPLQQCLRCELKYREQ